MSTAKRRAMKSSRKRPVDVITGPVPTIEHLIEEQAELLPSRMAHVNMNNPHDELMTQLKLQRWLAQKWRSSMIRWQFFALVTGGYSVVITYLWVHR